MINAKSKITYLVIFATKKILHSSNSFLFHLTKNLENFSSVQGIRGKRKNFLGVHVIIQKGTMKNNFPPYTVIDATDVYIINVQEFKANSRLQKLSLFVRGVKPMISLKKR